MAYINYTNFTSQWIFIDTECTDTAFLKISQARYKLLHMTSAQCFNAEQGDWLNSHFLSAFFYAVQSLYIASFSLTGIISHTKCFTPLSLLYNHYC